MTDVSPKINDRPYPPLVYAPTYDRLAAALDTPRVTAAMDQARAVLAGIRQERETQMTTDEYGNQMNVPPAPEPPRKPWYKRPIPLTALGIGVAGVLLSCTALAVAGAGSSPTDQQAPAGVTTHPTPPASTSAAPSKSKLPAAFLLEVTGPGRANVTTTADSATSSQDVKLPWRKEVKEVSGFVGLTVTVQKATADKPVSCKLTHRDEDGDLKVIAQTKTEPGDFATISCDHFGF